MASKILIIYLRLFIFTGMISSFSSKNLNYQQTLNNNGFSLSEYQELFQKIGFYEATVQYQHFVIPIPLGETIEELIKMSDELGRYQEEETNSRHPIAEINANLVKSG